MAKQPKKKKAVRVLGTGGEMTRDQALAIVNGETPIRAPEDMQRAQEFLGLTPQASFADTVRETNRGAAPGQDFNEFFLGISAINQNEPRQAPSLFSRATAAAGQAVGVGAATAARKASRVRAAAKPVASATAAAGKAAIRGGKSLAKKNSRSR